MKMACNKETDMYRALPVGRRMSIHRNEMISGWSLFDVASRIRFGWFEWQPYNLIATQKPCVGVG